jgi:hypothetical protein
VADKSLLSAYDGIDFPPGVVDSFGDVEHGEGLRNAEVQRIVCEDAARTDTATEAEGKGVRVWFRSRGEEAVRVESHRVVVDGRVVAEVPDT